MQKFPKSFWYFAGSQLITNLSDGITTITLTLLTLSVSVSSSHLGYVMAALSAPWFLLSIAAGIVIDRQGAYQTAKRANGLRALAFFLFAAFSVFGKLSIPLLAVFAFLMGTLEVLCDNSHSIFLPRILEKDQLEKANSIVSTAELASNKFIGVNLGSLFSMLSGTLSLCATGICYVMSCLFLSLSKRAGRGTPREAAYRPAPSPSRLTGKSFLSDVSFGLLYLFRKKDIGFFVLIGFILNLTAGMQLAFYILYITETLHYSQQVYSLLISFAGIGSLLGGVAVYFVIDRFGRYHVLVFCCAAVFFQFLFRYGTASLLPLFAASLLEGLSITAVNTISMSHRQREIEQECMGKVMATTRFLIVGATSLGSLAGGWAAESISYPVLGLAMGAASFLTVAFCTVKLKPYLKTGSKRKGETA